MADLDKNSLWQNMESGASNVATDVIGPSYSYSDNIPSPSSMGVGSDGSFGQLFRNIGAASEYVKIMITGDPPLGNAFFVNTGGSCTAPDGSVQPRHNYINNYSRGGDILPAGMSDLSFMTSSLNGLIPGVVGDIEGLNPVHLFTAMAADGTPSCQCYRCNVSSGEQYRFLTPELTPDFTSNNCSAVDMKFCVEKKEQFTNPVRSTMVPTVVAFLALAFLTFSGK